MNSSKSVITFLLLIASACLLACCTKTASQNREGKELPVLKKWSGDYPVAQLDQLPEGQHESRLGYIGETKEFAEVWQVFKPDEKVPEVDFSSHFVVFFRNVDFYNRTSISKIMLEDGVAEVIAIETRSAMPIEDRVAMALAVIPRAGIKFIQAGNESLPVTEKESAVDPLNATYTIERQEISLLNGRSEMEAAPSSATKIMASVFGEPVFGDLDDDGDEDAALLLVYDPGGSGTFYYVAVARNEKGTYRGTHGVLLGDRVAPHGVEIRNGLVVANYADRRPEEPMAARPSLGKSKYLSLNDGVLAVIQPLGEGEQVLEGWVTIGHEVRSFLPCSRKTDLWILGNSPALKEITAAYRQALPNSKSYTPLFMVLAGNYTVRPNDGFGTQYEGGVFATQLVRLLPKGNCRSGHIVVDAPTPGALVTSPLRVSGKARGTWFFEGDFPLVLTDTKGKIIAKGFVTAKGEWMTEKFVPFEGTLEFKKPRSGDRGTLTFKKDNPTGLSEHDDAVEIPVFLK
ncbi:MAG: Gmad2 immunoglobulin-like domain-containing protein [Deltaproteobacteria bacterium]|nr:MAG: Gmad2 immunoglobulin-like domain-containing protein [Deltaproteobacteria bacterium]